jgi:predicted amidohydrolase YtcJ
MPVSQELDGEGRMLVVPGFIDSHVHFLISGCGLASVHLRDVASKASFIDRIAQHARTRPSGAWIREGATEVLSTAAKVMLADRDTARTRTHTHHR